MEARQRPLCIALGVESQAWIALARETFELELAQDLEEALALIGEGGVTPEALAIHTVEIEDLDDALDRLRDAAPRALRFVDIGAGGEVEAHTELLQEGLAFSIGTSLPDPCVMAAAIDDVGRKCDRRAAALRGFAKEHRAAADAAEVAGLAWVTDATLLHVAAGLTNARQAVEGACGSGDWAPQFEELLERYELQARQSKGHDSGALTLVYEMRAALRHAREASRRSTAQASVALEHLAELEDVVDRQRRAASDTSIPEATGLHDLIADVVALCVDPVEDHYVRVFVDAPTTEVVVERHRLKVALSVVVANAMDAMLLASRGTAELHVTGTVDDELIAIEVRDTGTGIAADDLPHLFEADFSTKEMSTRDGLHRAALALQLLGGSIYCVDTAVGVGSTFRLEVPQAVASEDERSRRTRMAA